MAWKLIYTSAVRGLRPGTRGFCTVAATRGLLPATVQLLESLSGYHELFPTGSPDFNRNPVSCCHYLLRLQGRTVSLLSRIAPTTPDHTGRSNKLAQHYLLTSDERPAAGPAALLLTSDLFLASWDEPPQYLPETTVPEPPPRPCLATAWQKLSGETGHAAILPELFLRNPTQPVTILFEPGTDVLGLLAESLALLPEAYRWQITFNTCFSTLPPGVSCLWRCLPATPENRRETQRQTKSLLLDLTGTLPAPPDSPLTEAARTGTPVSENELPKPAKATINPNAFKLLR